MKNVLFICIGNCCRSQMAEGFARHLGAGVINAASAGLSPTPTIAGDTIAAMAEVGVDINDQFPKEFDYRLAGTYDIIVNMSGFDLPAMDNVLVTEWQVADPYYEEMSVFRDVRADIEKRVRRLIEDIRTNGTLTEDLVTAREADDKSRKPGLWQRLTTWR
jgi:arsenate reductase